MKHFKPSVLVALMLCVLIGYFEPANAQSSKSGYVALSTPFDVCPVWPNPIAPGGTLTAISFENVTSGILVSMTNGKQYPSSVIAYNTSFPLSTVEGNNYFVVDVLNNPDGSPSVVNYGSYLMPVLPTDTISGDSSTVEGNNYFVPIIKTYSSDPNGVEVDGAYYAPDFTLLTGTTLSIPAVPDDYYSLVIVTKSGYKFTTNITVSSK
jgi:hypothetical protein